MGRPRQVAEDQPGSEGPPTEERREIDGPTAHPGTDALASLLSQLDADTRVSVERLDPPYASGWLDDITIPGGQEASLMGLIRRSYGGGTFRLQLRRLKPSGNRVFTKGSATVQIAGEPMLHGKRVLPDGSLENPVAIPPAIMYGAPPQAGSQTELIHALAAFLRPQGQPNAAAQPPQRLDEVAALVRALRPDVMPVQPDPFSGLERTLALFAKMRTVFDTESRSPSAADDGGGFGGMSEGKLLMMLLANQNQQQHAPQWGPPPPWWNQQPPQTSVTPAAPAPTAPAPTAATSVGPTPDENPDNEADDDYTVDDVLEGIRGLSTEEQMELLHRVGEVLPAELGQQIEAQAQVLRMQK